MLVTLSGIETLTKPVQYSNVNSSIFVTPLGIIMLVKEIQP